MYPAAVVEKVVGAVVEMEMMVAHPLVSIFYYSTEGRAARQCHLNDQMTVHSFASEQRLLRLQAVAHLKQLPKLRMLKLQAVADLRMLKFLPSGSLLHGQKHNYLKRQEVHDRAIPEVFDLVRYRY